MATWTDCICPAIQQALNNVARYNGPALIRDRVGTLEALTSPLNTSGFEKIRVNEGNGKYKQVDVNYIKRKTEAWINTTCSDTCDEGREPGPYCERVNVDNCYETDNLVFDEDNMRRICAPLGENDQMWIADQMMSIMNPLLTLIDKWILGQINANFGKFTDGGTLAWIQLFDKFQPTYATWAGPRSFALSRIKHEIKQSGFSGSPMIIGEGDLDLFFDALNRGAVNMAGVNLASFKNDGNFFFDRFTEDTIGNNEFIVMVPGVVQLLEWDKYVGPYAKKSLTFEHGTIVDPFTGMRFDLKMHYNDCSDTYYIKLQKNFDIFFLPDDSFIESDDSYGINGVWNWKYCDALVDCENESLSSISSESVVVFD